jgi:hypothetical protein
MHQRTDDFITNTQQKLVGIVKDWKYEYGADYRVCSAMLSRIVLKLNPTARIDPGMLEAFGQMPDADPSAQGQ